jgi:hypothetical protein
MEFLPFILFGAAFAAVVTWAVAKGRADAAVRARTLVEMGFASAPSDAETLAAAVARHENNPAYRYRVSGPMRAAVDGKPVWFYAKERAMQGHAVSAHEFRFPLHRPSAEGLVLFYKPTALASGTTATLIGSLATSGFDSQPDDLTRLEIPVDRKHGNLIGVLGPARASLYELIDARTLAALEPVGDFGALVVICRGDWCSLGSSTTRMDLDLVRLWSIVQQLVAS